MYLGKGSLYFPREKSGLLQNGGETNWGLFWSTESRLFQSKFVCPKSSHWSSERVDDRPLRGVQRSFSADERRSAEERSGQAVRLRLANSSQQEYRESSSWGTRSSPNPSRRWRWGWCSSTEEGGEEHLVALTTLTYSGNNVVTIQPDFSWSGRPYR